MFRLLINLIHPTPPEDQQDALIAADFALCRRAAADAAELTGDKSDELPTTVTDAARIGLCD